LKLFRINSVLTALRAVVGWPFLVVGSYLVAALIGSLVPANPDWREPRAGVDIFLESNGVHVSLVVPITALGYDLSDLIRPDQLSNPMLYGTHAMIGWGHTGVYRNAESWGDVKSGDVVSAISGSDFTTLHVYHLTNPKRLPHRKILRVTAGQYRSIIMQVRAAFRLDKQRQSVAYPAYGSDNIFYDAIGHYNALNTCNTWTGNVLKTAGVRVGLWTPLPSGLMLWF
jgi:uncharacterized protein (TIGR02117 family)